MKILIMTFCLLTLPLSGFAASMKIEPTVRGHLIVENGLKVVSIVAGMNIQYCVWGHCSIRDYSKPNKEVPVYSEQVSGTQEYFFEVREKSTLNMNKPSLFSEFSRCTLSIKVVAENAEGQRFETSAGIAVSENARLCADRTEMSKAIQNQLDSNTLKLYMVEDKLFLTL